MIEHVSAPAPRMLLRLFALQSLLDTVYAGRPSPTSMIEVGPGLGDASSILHARFDLDTVTLYEQSDGARARLATRFAREDAFSVRGAFEPSSEKAELLLCFEVVEHIDADVAFLSSLRDGLVPGGLLIGSVPAYARKWQAVDDYAGHVQRYEPDEMHEKLSSAGFVDPDVRVYGAPLTNLLYLPRQLYYRSRRSGRSSEARLQATLRSGTDRDLVDRFDKGIVYWAVKLFARLQEVPGLARHGDGLLFVARNPERSS